MTEPLIMFGEFRFAIDTAVQDSLDRNRSWRVASGDVVGKDPVLQYIGPGQDEISLNGVIYPHHAGGLGQIETLAVAADSGIPRILMTGYGKVLGTFYITSLTETETNYLRGGVPRRIAFRATFTRKERDT